MRDDVIEECAALMDRWAQDAEAFDDVPSDIYRCICRNAAKAIRGLCVTERLPEAQKDE